MIRSSRKKGKFRVEYRITTYWKRQIIIFKWALFGFAQLKNWMIGLQISSAMGVRCGLEEYRTSRKPRRTP